MQVPRVANLGLVVEVRPEVWLARDPVSGVESRLRSLGYSAGQSARPSAKSGRVVAPDTKVALAIFQTDAELDVSGEPDDATLDKIKDSYGC